MAVHRPRGLVATRPASLDPSPIVFDEQGERVDCGGLAVQPLQQENAWQSERASAPTNEHGE